MPPTCLLHIPKSAGVSIHTALEAALPPGSLAPYRGDRAGLRTFTAVNPLELGAEMRRQSVLDDHDFAELASYRAAVGHFALPTLLRVTGPERIATILREPRARLLSLYVFFRLPSTRAFWEPLHSHLLADAGLPLAEFLAEPRAARATDNQVCRLLLDDDPRIPADNFIAPEHVEPLADAAIDRLGKLGFVGVLEERDAAWRGLSEIFGAELGPVRANVSSTNETAVGIAPAPDEDRDIMLAALQRRAAADRIVYETLATRSRAETAFVEQLARFDDLRILTRRRHAAIPAEAGPCQPRRR